MAAAKNVFQMWRLISALPRNNHPSLTALNKETSSQILPAASLISTRNDFYRRGFQTQTNLTDDAEKDSKNHVTGCSQPDSVLANPHSETSSSNTSSPTHSVVSNLKTSARHDLAMIFTCKVCETRSIKTCCRESYQKGVVVVRCGGCNNLHLIADHLGWFGEPGSIEDILASRGEEVKKGCADTLSLTLDDLAGKKILND